ncbi:hypothetical protein C9I92_21235 [Photobacterium ganghwense]|uniref:Uncharacterized protein n=1 Tax=Photobacterium ganghwense TaxID=320778 RepID=A0A0J1HEL8_9GAMM|nr:MULTISPECIES: hypothetical protein [Photobacterium]KLV10089.1 hypothetical protein ABT57_05705 [Photobacterium ganghwense]PSU05323.1 hypothetical protein C9I92_21235 [Photobacterium ganghwense]QSV17297.1 hypothetical protein FH974_20425 [Photobacterium ganghwense]
MTIKRKVRPNLTNYDVIEMVQHEIRESERRIFRKTIMAIFTGVLCIVLFIYAFFTIQGGVVRDYAAEAMRKAFEAERAVHIIDEAAGTNFLDQAQGHQK